MSEQEKESEVKFSDDKDQPAPASFSSAVINMVNSTLGAGMLGIPLAYSKAGLVPAIILHILMGLMSYLSFWYLTYGSEATGMYSYGELAHHLYGNVGTLIVEICTFAYTFGPMWSYCIMIGDFLPSVLRGVGVSEDSLLTNRVFVVIIIAAFIIQPLTWLRSLNALRFTSFFGMISMMFCVLVICIRFFAPADNDVYKDGVEAVHASPSMIQTFSTLCFAFGCQQNIPIIHGEIYEKSTKKMNIICLIGVFIVGIFYMLAGIFGYCTFTDFFSDDSKSDNPGNILTLYKDDDYLVFAARLASLVTVTFCCPINALPARVALYNIYDSIVELYHEHKGKGAEKSQTFTTTSGNATELGTVSQTESTDDAEGTPNKNTSESADSGEEDSTHHQEATLSPPNQSTDTPTSPEAASAANRPSGSPPPSSSSVATPPFETPEAQSIGISPPNVFELSRHEGDTESPNLADAHLHNSISQSPTSVSPILQHTDGANSAGENFTFAPHPESHSHPPSWKYRKILCLTVEIWISSIIGTVMVILAVILAIFLPNVSFVFDFLGSTAGVVVAFLFPGALFIRLARQPHIYADLNRDPNTTRPEGIEEFHRRNEKIMVPQGWTSPWIISAIIVFALGVIFGLFSLALAIIFDTSLGDDIDW